MEIKGYHIDTGASSGRFNMDFDLRLASESEESSFYLRFYRWDPFCVSLGANQPEEGLNIEALHADGFDFVRRPTGGRAVFHSEELTYSVILNKTDLTPRESYNAINEALLMGLVNYDKRLSAAGLSGDEVNFKEHYRSAESVACFSVPSKSEVKLDGRKLIGSAQRKIGGVILQHGSINTGSFHKKIVDYLNIDRFEKVSLKMLLDTKTSDIKSIIGEDVDMERLKISILDGFRERFSLDFEELLIEKESLENK